MTSDDSRRPARVNVVLPAIHFNVVAAILFLLPIAAGAYLAWLVGLGHWLSRSRLAG